MGCTPDPIVVVIEPFGGSMRQHSPQLPLVFVDDAAVTRGDGVFETLLLRGGRVCNAAMHAARFQSSAQLLDLPAPNTAQWLGATQEAAAQWFARTDQDAKCVWTYTRGRASTGIPSAWLTVSAVPEQTITQREQGVRVMTSPRGYSLDIPEEGSSSPAGAPWLVVGAKTLNYAANMAALRWAQAHGFDDVIFTEGNRILEGTTSTVVTVRGNKLRTPAPEGNILPGTTQAALFEVAQAQGWNCKLKTNMDLEYLTEKADSVWLVSSVRMAARVRRINDTKLRRPDNAAEIEALIAQAIEGR